MITKIIRPFIMILIVLPLQLLSFLFVPKKNKKSSIGDIYYVEPKHVVKPQNMQKYSDSRDVNKKRPVIVAVQRGRNVQVSEMTTVRPTKKQTNRYQMVKLENESKRIGKNSYVDTRTISRSKATNKKFQPGNAPLIKSSRKASESDITTLNNARKKRWPGIK